MASSTAEADIEAQSGLVTDPPPANNAGAPSTDITPNPQPPLNHDLQATNTNDPPNGNPPASQTAKNLEVQRSTLTCSIHDIYNLIHPVDENHGDSSDGLWSMYLTEAEKQDKEVTDSWKGDTDGILVFVSPALVQYLVRVHRLIHIHIEDGSVLGHRRDLHYRKPPELKSRSQRSDQCTPCSNISTTCQHFQ